jgi:hypothetical protein
MSADTSGLHAVLQLKGERLMHPVVLTQQLLADRRHHLEHCAEAVRLIEGRSHSRRFWRR